MDVKRSVAIVTGASSGIGAATAEALARQGSRVVAVARRKDRLDEVVERCRAHSPDSFAHPADIGDRDSAEGIVAAVHERFGHADILVNNAGMPHRVRASEASVEDIDEVMRVNFLGAVWVTMAALPSMLERRFGGVVNVTSVAGVMPVPNEAGYGASKAALSRWSEGLAVDLADTGVYVGVVAPGPIDTEIWDRGKGEAHYKGRLYPPTVVADAIVGALRHERPYVTAPRQYGVVTASYSLLRRPIRAGMQRFRDRNERD